jgi:hypothetical protein
MSDILKFPVPGTRLCRLNKIPYTIDLILIYRHAPLMSTRRGPRSCHGVPHMLLVLWVLILREGLDGSSLPPGLS